MDPNENLRKQLEIADQDDAEDLAELVLDLNRWLCGGGFLPDAWKR